MSSSLPLFRTRDITNDYTTRVHRSTAAVGHLFEAKRFRVVERAGGACCGLRMGVPFHTISELSRAITRIIDDAHELDKRTTVYNINIMRTFSESGQARGLYIMAEFA